MFVHSIASVIDWTRAMLRQPEGTDQGFKIKAATVNLAVRDSDSPTRKQCNQMMGRAWGLLVAKKPEQSRALFQEALALAKSNADLLTQARIHNEMSFTSTAQPEAAVAELQAAHRALKLAEGDYQSELMEVVRGNFLQYDELRMSQSLRQFRENISNWLGASQFQRAENAAALALCEVEETFGLRHWWAAMFLNLGALAKLAQRKRRDGRRMLSCADLILSEFDNEALFPLRAEITQNLALAKRRQRRQ